MPMGTEIKCGKAAPGFGVVRGDRDCCPGRKFGRDGFADFT